MTDQPNETDGEFAGLEQEAGRGQAGGGQAGRNIPDAPIEEHVVAPRLIDTFGRIHRNLRISVTDRCNIRCFYCMPADVVSFLPRHELLTFEEIERTARIAVSLGIRRLRLTGGEPLVRRELHRLIALLAIPGVEDIGLTTNGILLAEQADLLFQAGLRRLNVSLDALTAESFEKITRRTGFEQVLAGIEAARAGFSPIKLNAVAIRGITEAQLIPFAELARKTNTIVRFIEYMPLDADGQWRREQVLTAAEMIGLLEAEFGKMLPVTPATVAGPATDYRFADGKGEIGFIGSVTQPFCESCDRFRLTAEGTLRNCLFSLEETDIRSLLRNGGSDQQIAERMISCIAAKQRGHEINTAEFVQPDRPMHSIGG